ncbi:MAG: LysR family transcriptional regulator [Pseudomonadaceae bacterium]|nr:LysR family transcriptional regulator [Pseudomonadaceae bacterium]
MRWQRTAFDWNQARAFLVTAEEGSLSAAARALKLTQPTLSRQVAGLEETLGVTLFERTPRALLLTQPGTELLEHFRSMGDAADRISIAATGQAETIIGHVAITSTEMMATHYLLPILKQLHGKAPGLKVELVTSNQLSDLLRREADIAIRHTRPQEDNLIAKRVRTTTAQLYASSTYIKEVGRPKHVSDLAAMQFVGSEDPEWLIGPLSRLGIEVTSANFNFSAVSGTVLLELLRQGFGLGFLPTDIAERYPELEKIWPALEPMQIETWLVAHRELRTNPRIRLVFDLLSEGLS